MNTATGLHNMSEAFILRPEEKPYYDNNIKSVLGDSPEEIQEKVENAILHNRTRKPTLAMLNRAIVLTDLSIDTLDTLTFFECYNLLEVFSKRPNTKHKEEKQTENGVELNDPIRQLNFMELIIFVHKH